MVENLTGILLPFKQHLFQHIYSIDKNLGGMRQALEKLRIAKITPFTHKTWPCINSNLGILQST